MTDKQHQIRAYCTKCDKDLEYLGIALDCPIDGHYYACKRCKYRIVIFINENIKERKIS